MPGARETERVNIGGVNGFVAGGVLAQFPFGNVVAVKLIHHGNHADKGASHCGMRVYLFFLGNELDAALLQPLYKLQGCNAIA